VYTRTGSAFDPAATNPRRHGPPGPGVLHVRGPIRSLGEMPAPHSLGDDSMFFYMAGYYLAIKLVFFYSLVRAQIKFDTLKDHWLFLGILFTAATGFLFYTFILSWQDFPWPSWQLKIARNFGILPWQAYLTQVFLLSTLYFWLMSKFDEGVIFWTLLLLGVPFVLFF
jgi:hypothetical protein